MISNLIITCRTDRFSLSSLRNGSPASEAGKAAGCTEDKAEHRNTHIITERTLLQLLYSDKNQCFRHIIFNSDTYSYDCNEQVLPQEVFLVQRRKKCRLKQRKNISEVTPAPKNALNHFI